MHVHPHPYAFLWSRRLLVLFFSCQVLLTESLFDCIRRGVSSRQKIEAYVKHMKEDARREESALDINHRDIHDDNNTIFMKAVLLFGRICASQHAMDGLDFDSMDKGGVKDHLDKLMTNMELTTKNAQGYDPLNFLVNQSQKGKVQQMMV